MQKLVLDPESRAKLLQAGSQVELCDDEGHAIGLFLPLASAESARYDWLRAQISDEELQRRKREEGGRTTAEVFNRLVAS